MAAASEQLAPLADATEEASPNAGSPVAIATEPIALEPAEDAPAPARQVAATQALVAYLLSLKKGYDLPDEHPGPVDMPKSDDSP